MKSHIRPGYHIVQPVNFKGPVALVEGDEFEKAKKYILSHSKVDEGVVPEFEIIDSIES